MVWLRDNIGLLENASDSQHLAEEAPESGSVIFVPAFSGLYAPYWRQDARGVICGITEDTTSNHIVKATLEAVYFQVRDILDAMNKDCGIPLQTLKVDGGMTANRLLMQMQSDFIGINVVKAGLSESTALGAAMVAQWAVGFGTKGGTISVKEGETFGPKMGEDQRDLNYKQWKMGVERAMNWDVK